MTIKAHYEMENGDIEVYVFGDSYKSWKTQMEEFEDYGRRKIKLLELYKSANKFVQNGLKWCDYDHYQEELDEEAEQVGRKPRQLSNFQWQEARR